MTGRIRERWERVLAFFRRRDLDREFDDEARSHMDLAVDDYVQCGMSAGEARRLARVKFGAVEASKDAHRDSRSLVWLEGVVSDLRFALRGLRRDWKYASAAVAMLALALALNATVFTIADAMLFRGIPLVKDADRLIRIQQIFPSGAAGISYPDLEEWRAHAPSLEGIAFVATRPITLRIGTGGLVDTSAYVITANTFGLLGVRPMLGRDFVDADERPGAPPVAILTHRGWESRFGKRADVLGTTVAINGTPTTIVGVMPERFDFPHRDRDIWVPVVLGPELQRRGHSGYMSVGRLRRGATTQEASAQLQTIHARLAAAYPETNRDLRLRVEDYSGSAGPNGRTIYGSQVAGAWLVLLIACANLANLTLVRTVGRWRDLSTRIALGAGTARIVRQLLVESLLLTTVAAVFGWGITAWSLHRWSVATASVFEVLDYSVNGATAVYLVTISIAAALLVSVVPIARVVRFGLRAVLKSDIRSATHDLQRKRLTDVLVAAQVALAIVLLLGAGVLVRSLMNVVNAQTGVHEPERVLVGSTRLPSDKYPDAAARLAYFDRLESQLTSVTGIEAVSLASTIPVNGMGQHRLEIEGRATASGRDEFTGMITITPGYFTVAGAAPIAGRGFDDGDRANTLRVAMVNESFAAAYWPGEQAVGKRLRVGNQQPPGTWLTVVGVAPGIMQGDPTRERFLPFVYVPLRQRPLARVSFLARTRGPGGELAPAVRTAITDLDSDVTLDDLGSLKASFAFDRDRMDLEHMELGKHASVAPVFAVMALLLAAIGLAAVMAHSVAQRTKEIGVRMAIGATASDVRRLVFREGMMPVLVGLPFGLAASLAVNRILQSQLVGVSPYDPATMAGAPVLLIAIAFAACQIPARRATGVEPVVALRHE